MRALLPTPRTPPQAMSCASRGKKVCRRGAVCASASSPSSLSRRASSTGKAGGGAGVLAPKAQACRAWAVGVRDLSAMAAQASRVRAWGPCRAACQAEARGAAAPAPAPASPLPLPALPLPVLPLPALLPALSAAARQRAREAGAGVACSAGAGAASSGALCLMRPRAEAREAPLTATGMTRTQLGEATAT